MKYKTETQINRLGTKIDTIESINNALISSLLGTESLTRKDAYNFLYILENRIKDLKITHEKLVKDLNI